MPEVLRKLDIPEGFVAWSELPDPEQPELTFPVIKVVYDNGKRTRFAGRHAMSTQQLTQAIFDFHWQILISLVQDLYRGTLEYKLERFAMQLDLYGRGL